MWPLSEHIASGLEGNDDFIQPPCAGYQSNRITARLICVWILGSVIMRSNIKQGTEHTVDTNLECERTICQYGMGCPLDTPGIDEMPKSEIEKRKRNMESISAIISPASR